MDVIIGTVRHYHWGDPTFIPSLLGVEPDGRPHAELWLGAHSGAPSTLASGVSLAEAVAADRRGVLGTALVDDARPFPFLAKVLSAASPLSIQLHPSTAQARAGFAAEEADGPDVDAPDRTYRDPFPKPELICALTPFTAKCGLRHPDATVELLAGLGDDPAVRQLIGWLTTSGDPAARLRHALAVLLALDDDARTALVDEVVAAAAATRDASGGEMPADGPAAAVIDWTLRLAQTYPGDVGVVIALLLNHVELAPGEALYLGAGNLHSYLEGSGIEVMAPSDNVVRGGLTSKHIDTVELARLMDTSPIVPDIQRPDGPVHDYRVDDGLFGLRRVELATAPSELVGPGIALVTEGRATLVAAGGTVVLAAGQAALVTAADGPVQASGNGILHHAHAGPTILR